MGAPKRAAFLVGLLVNGIGLAACSARLPEVRQVKCEPSFDRMEPTEFVSPSKAFRLEVVPKDKPFPGFGGAGYRMTYKGKESWAIERNYTLRCPLVTDEGTVVGVAYRYEDDGPVSPGSGEYLHIIISREGQDVLDRIVERIPPTFDASPEPPFRPYAEILTVDPGNDRIIVAVLEHDAKEWIHPACWIFRLSTGEILSRIDLPLLFAGLPSMNSIKMARPVGGSPMVSELQVVAGTPLILLHCGRYNDSYAEEGRWEIEDSLFILMDSAGTPVWSLSVPKNTAVATNEWYCWFGRTWYPPHPMLITGKPGCFGVFLAGEDSVATYTVKRDRPEGWSVTEAGRTTLAKAYREHGVESQPCP